MDPDVELLESWSRSLRARARSAATVDAYLTDTNQFSAWCAANGTTLTTAGRRDVEAFLAGLHDSPGWVRVSAPM
jgi:site-specific recombinase XerD